MDKMKICWQYEQNVVCIGKVFEDGFGVIVLLKGTAKPWIWKVSV